MGSKLVSILKDKLGVEKIYFCSGARNNEILRELGDHFKLLFRLDERSASFEALGNTMHSKKPVVVCTTSGTAVAECLPAVIEAYYHELPLIIMSADRPGRLRTTHAAQAIDQVNIFSSYINSRYSGELAKFNKISTKYPMHINLEIDDSNFDGIKGLVLELAPKNFETFKKPLLFISQGCKLAPSDIEFLDSLPLLKFNECLSPFWFRDSDLYIKYEKTLTKLIAEGEIDSIVHFGKTPIAKLWREMEKNETCLPVINLGREKFGLSRGFYTFEKIELFKHLANLKAHNKVEEELIFNSFKDLEYCEINIIDSILSQCEPNDLIFVGNSMPIRYVELLKKRELKYYSSRGANGIDGQLATAMGIAKNTDANVIAIVGDLTFLYDFSSLFETIPKNLIIHVIDNNGGRIFEQVNVDKRLINPPGVSCSNIVQKLELSDSVIVHAVNNSETALFWERWKS